MLQFSEDNYVGCNLIYIIVQNMDIREVLISSSYSGNKKNLKNI